MSGLSAALLIAIFIIQFCVQAIIPIAATAANGAQLDEDYYLETTDRDIILDNGVWTLQKLVDNYPDVFEVINEQNSSSGVDNNSSTLHANKEDDENSKNVAVLMSKPLVIGKQANLKISDAHLLLESFPSEEVFPARILVLGKAIIENSTIDSLRQDQRMPERNPLHPRPFIAAVDGGVIEVRNTTVKHMGFALGGLSSIAAVNYYGTENFEITNSIFEYNYIGFYSDNSSDFELRGNTFYWNTHYGIDPHTGSKNLLIDSNHVSLSGRQGIICSFLCDNVTITNNVVEEGVEGIGLHWLTNSSKIQNNTIKNNEQFGIFIKNSSTSNVIEGNTLTNNGCNIGLFEYANGNTIVDNIVVDTFTSQQYCDNDYVYNDNQSEPNNIGRNILITDSNSSSYGISVESIENYNPQNIGFEKYNNSFPQGNKSAMINIAFEYPVHWRKVSENHNNVIAEFSIPSGSNATGDGSSTHGAWNSTAIFAIEAQTDNANNCGQDGTTACLDVAIHTNIDKVIEENPSLEVIQSEPISISGMPAYRIVFLQTNGTEDPRNNKIDEIYALDEDSGIQYTIRFEADNHTYARNLLVLDKVIESISLSST
jgi:parallel beta-helix repeat protein